MFEFPVAEISEGWQVAAAIAACIGALASAASAIAAWRAATASQRTATEATEALAYAVEPTLELSAGAVDHGDQGRAPWRVAIANPSRFAAKEVAIEAEFRDGERAYKRFDVVEPGTQTSMILREVDAPPAGPRPEQAGRHLTLRYRDERELARYEQDYAFTSRQDSEGKSWPTGGIFVLGPPQRIR